MEAYKGTSRPERAGQLPLTRGSPFFLMHHPMSWEYVESAKKWLPTFATLPEEAGINGVRQTQSGPPDSRNARVEHQDLGYTILDYRSLEYLTRHPTHDGGYIYSLIFSNPKVLGGKVFWKLNEKDYNVWRNSLLEEGHIDQPDPDAISLLIERWNRRITRHYRNSHLRDADKKIKAMEKTLLAMKKAHSELTKTK